MNGELLGPIERDRVTTLTDASLIELATLTAAIAISLATGREVIPGLAPDRPCDVSIFAFEGFWVDWKSLLSDIAAVAQIPVPMIGLCFPREPFLQHRVERDPDAERYWAPYRAADEAETRKAGRDPVEDRVFIVFGLERAIGFGLDGAMAALYQYFEGISTLLVGGKTAFHEGNQLSGERWAGDFGAVVSASDLRDQLPGVRDFFRALAAVRLASERRERTQGETSPRLAAHNARRAAMRADAFFASEPAETLRAILEGGRSPEAHLIKVRAKATYGITGGQLWHAARRLEAALADTTMGEPGVLTGYTAVWDVWVEVNRSPDGHFLQRLAPGCFSKTITESKDRMKVNFMHGKSQQFGRRALGPTEELALLEDDYGLRYTLPLFDTEENRQLAAGLRAGLYGSSFSMHVVAEHFVVRPGRSAHNLRGLPERTVLEARLPDFGPVASPLYPTTTAGIRT
jgi:HK97 family phage prohead protease